MRKTDEKKSIKLVIYVKLKFLRQFLKNILEFVSSKQICVKFVKKKNNK